MTLSNAWGHANTSLRQFFLVSRFIENLRHWILLWGDQRTGEKLQWAVEGTGCLFWGLFPLYIGGGFLSISLRN